LGTLCSSAVVTIGQVRRICPFMSVKATFSIANPPIGLAKSLEVGRGNEISRLKCLAIERDRTAPVVPLISASGLAVWRGRYCHNNAFCHSAGRK